MRRTLSRRTNRPRLSAGLRASVVVLVVAGLVLGWRLAFPGLFLAAAAPVLEAGNALAASVGGVTAVFGNARTLAKENAALTSENAALAAENRALAERLRDITALVGTSSPAVGEPAGIAAGVIARPPVSPYDTLLIAAGSATGVTRGMEAFGRGGTPLGIVSAVSAGYARVTLFSAPGVETSAWAGAGRVPLTLRGAGAGAFTAEAPQGAGIAEGDAVFVAGPGAIPVGIVVAVAARSSNPSAEVRVAPAANPFSLAWVRLAPSAALASSTLSAPQP